MIINTNIEFLHIPHTGGKFLSASLSKNYLCDHYQFLREYKGCSIDHLNVFESNSFYASSRMFQRFTIVRNPLDKFIACLKGFNRINQKTIDYMFENETNFFNTVNKIRENKVHNNFFEPQINFLEFDTKFWKFENGFNEQFDKWLMDNFNLKLYKFNENELKKFKEEKYFKNEINLNEKQKQYIKNYYYLDYKILDYK